MRSPTTPFMSPSGATPATRCSTSSRVCVPAAGGGGCCAARLLFCCLDARPWPCLAQWGGRAWVRQSPRLSTPPPASHARAGSAVTSEARFLNADDATGAFKVIYPRKQVGARAGRERGVRLLSLLQMLRIVERACWLVLRRRSRCWAACTAHSAHARKHTRAPAERRLRRAPPPRPRGRPGLVRRRPLGLCIDMETAAA